MALPKLLQKLFTNGGTGDKLNWDIIPDISYNDLTDKPTFSSISLLDVYPVGAIYTSVSATNPSTLFGGTWEAIAAGRVLIGAGGGYTAGQTGGSASHSITISEMPSHNHGGSTGSVGAGGYHAHSDNNFASSGGGQLKNGESAHPHEESSYGSGRLNTGSANGMPAHSHTISSQGGGTAMSLMQPYLVVYMWKRTA
jgi:microcystin-dependent protein